jgi:hypothetical protein
LRSGLKDRYGSFLLPARGREPFRTTQQFRRKLESLLAMHAAEP